MKEITHIGAVKNDVLCRLRSDTSGMEIVRPVADETTALGSAYAAGLVVGHWSDPPKPRDNRKVDREFSPAMTTGETDQLTTTVSHQEVDDDGR